MLRRFRHLRCEEARRSIHRLEEVKLSVEKKRLVGRRLAISICGIVACDPTGTLELCALFDRIERLVRILLKREWPVVLVCGKACVLCRELLRSECDTFQVRV